MDGNHKYLVSEVLLLTVTAGISGKVVVIVSKNLNKETVAKLSGRMTFRKTQVVDDTFSTFSVQGSLSV